MPTPIGDGQVGVEILGDASSFVKSIRSAIAELKQFKDASTTIVRDMQAAGGKVMQLAASDALKVTQAVANANAAIQQSHIKTTGILREESEKRYAIHSKEISSAKGIAAKLESIQEEITSNQLESNRKILDSNTSSSARINHIRETAAREAAALDRKQYEVGEESAGSYLRRQQEILSSAEAKISQIVAESSNERSIIDSKARTRDLELQARYNALSQDLAAENAAKQIEIARSTQATISRMMADTDASNLAAAAIGRQESLSVASANYNRAVSRNNFSTATTPRGVENTSAAHIRAAEGEAAAAKAAITSRTQELTNAASIEYTTLFMQARNADERTAIDEAYQAKRKAIEVKANAEYDAVDRTFSDRLIQARQAASARLLAIQKEEIAVSRKLQSDALRVRMAEMRTASIQAQSAISGTLIRSQSNSEMDRLNGMVIAPKTKADFINNRDVQSAYIGSRAEAELEAEQAFATERIRVEQEVADGKLLSLKEGTIEYEAVLAESKEKIAGIEAASAANILRISEDRDAAIAAEQIKSDEKIEALRQKSMRMNSPGSGYTIQRAGRQAFEGGILMGIPLAAAAVGASGFNQARMVAENNTDLSKQQREEMTNNAMSLMREGTPQNPKAIFDSLMRAQNFRKDGQTMADTLGIVRIALMAATAKGADAEKTTQALAQTMYQFNVPAKDAAQTMNLLAAVAAKENLKLEDLAENTGRAFAAAAVLHIPLYEAASAYAVLTKAGNTSAQSATSLRSIYQFLASPVAKTRIEIENLSKKGIELKDIFGLQNVAARGLGGTMDALISRLQKSGMSHDKIKQEILALNPAMRSNINLVELMIDQHKEFNSTSETKDRSSRR